MIIVLPKGIGDKVTVVLTAISFQQCAVGAQLSLVRQHTKGLGIVILRSKTCVGNESDGRCMAMILFLKPPIGNTGVRILSIMVGKLLKTL